MTIAPPVPDDSAWHRLSPRMLLVHPVIELGRALPALAGIVFAGSSSGSGSWWGLGAAGVVTLLSLTRWFTTRLRITADQVQLRHGLVRRRTITTGRDRIRTVDVTAHFMHRLLGLARLVIGTGSNDRKGGGRIVLDGLSAAGAAALRIDLLTRRAQPVSEVRTLAALDPRWIRFAPFTLSGVITGLIIWGSYSRAQSESHVDLTRTGPFRAVVRGLDGLPTAGAVLVVAGALVAFVAVTSTVGYVLAFWNFRLVQQAGGTLQVTRGLITARATSIERRRLVGVTIAEPLVLRAVGGARTLAVATGLRTGRGAERGGEVLLPPAPVRVAEATAIRALGSSVLSARLESHGRAARTRRLTRALSGALLFLALALVGWLTGGSPWLPGVGAAFVLLAVPLARDRYRNLGHAVTDGYLVTRSGSVVRRRSALRADAVIGWNLHSTYFQRRAGLTTVVATTAAGAQGYRVLDLGHDDAMLMADRITPGLLGQFGAH